MNNNNSMGMYIHIPFCVKKCLYCDFLSGSYNDTIMTSYIESLIKELHLHSYIYGKHGANYIISTIFIGGGTPSILDSKYITRILNTIKECFNLEDNAEISIEANPGTLSIEKAETYIACGINRLSIGLQTTNENELSAIGRIHSYEDFLRSYDYAINAGFSNINIDLMSALPYQSLESYRDTLNRVLKLSPTHISAYSLILEEGTPLHKHICEGHENILPDEDTEREMYYLTKELLQEYGYNRYEISNYSKVGYECKHNLSYWSDVPYLGIGIGASSYVKKSDGTNIRYQNISDIYKYIDIFASIDNASFESLSQNEYTNNIISSIQCEETILTETDSMEEYMYLGLRKTLGISIARFNERFGKDIFEVYGDIINKYSKLELISINDDTIALTDKGLDVSNTIFSDFLLS